MAVTNYTELQAYLADFLNRDDLTAQIPTFIQLAEKEIARRLRKTVTVASLDLSSQTVMLPGDCAELRSIRLDTDSFRHALEIGTPEWLSEFLTTSSGVPYRAAVLNQTLYLDRPPSETFPAEIVYFQTLTPLSGAQPTSTLLTDAPDLYIYGALREAAGFLEWDERYERWADRFERALVDEETRRQNAEYGASLAPIRLPVVFG